MQKPVCTKLNRDNLILAADILRSVSPIPFFGTLLGLVREGDIIADDDDVDLYIDVVKRAEVVSIMSTAGFNVIYEGDWFLQFTRNIEEITTFVDVYLYENPADTDYIVERWNFRGTPNEDRYHLHIPKDAVFPLQPTNLFDANILLPNKPEFCCSFLYGSSWRQPFSKAQREYKVVVYNNVPLFIESGEFPFLIVVENEALMIDNARLKLRIDELEEVERIRLGERGLGR
ncbi:hypothetical protein [Agrobacterium rosae]|uniref:Nucleotidyltransferase family protein n=1 Tax=Agrobacterium rosae TaxID=1972867 RepID=A0AAW9FGU7_9HYPH|nr:hypothetical protein [Agrobacterium rosae]MDX8305837.1 hypothetical protein [Agrobacterium rosae]